MEAFGVAKVFIHSGYSSRFKTTMGSCPSFNCNPVMTVPGFMTGQTLVAEMKRLVVLDCIALPRRCIVMNQIILLDARLMHRVRSEWTQGDIKMETGMKVVTMKTSEIKRYAACGDFFDCCLAAGLAGYQYQVPGTGTCYQEGPGSARFMRTFQFRLKAQ